MVKAPSKALIQPDHFALSHCAIPTNKITVLSDIFYNKLTNFICDKSEFVDNFTTPNIIAL